MTGKLNAENQQKYIIFKLKNTTNGTNNYPIIKIEL